MRPLLGLSLIALLAVHCGSSSQETPPSSVTDAGAPGTGSGVVTPSAGGTVKTADGRVTIDVPPGAVPADTVITITPSTSYFDDGAVVPGTVYDFSPDGIVFGAPVTMTIAYDPARIPAGIDEADLRIHKAHPSSWSEIAGGALDAGAHLARAEVSSFSSYGVRSRRGPASQVDASTDAPVEASSDGGGAPVGTFVAASGFTTAVGGIRVSGAHLYWSGFSLGTGAGIKRMPLAGGAIEDVVTAHPEPIWGAAEVGGKLLFADDAHVIYSVTLGGAPVLHAASDSFASDGDLVSDGTSLYWAGLDNETDASIARTSATASSCTQRAVLGVACAQTPSCDPGERTMACTDQGPDALLTCCAALETFALRRSQDFPLSRARRMVLDGGYAYWTENSTAQAWVLRKALAGGDVEVIATEVVQNNGANTFQTLAVAGGRVYWSRPLSGSRALLSAPVTGGAPRKEASGEAWEVGADGTHVYFSGELEQTAGVLAQGIFRVPIAGGPVQQVARAEGGAPTSLRTDFAITATHVYYFEQVGSGVALKRVPR